MRLAWYWIALIIAGLIGAGWWLYKKLSPAPKITEDTPEGAPEPEQGFSVDGGIDLGFDSED